MKKNISLLLLSVACSAAFFAQNFNIQNANNYRRSKDLDKAKAAIDLAASNDETKNKPKMFLYRAQIYMDILETKDERFKNLDPEAEEKAFTAVVNCLKADKDKTFYDDIKVYLMPTAMRVYNKAVIFQNNKQFEAAMNCLKMLYEGIPFDKDDALKHQNITVEKLNFQMYHLALFAGNTGVEKEYLQKLIDSKYKDPAIYIDMAGLYEKEGDFAKQLSFIEAGRRLFDDNPALINAEITYYIKQKRTDELLTKVTQDIEGGSDNEYLYFIQAFLLEERKEYEKAESAYKKAIR